MPTSAEPSDLQRRLVWLVSLRLLLVVAIVVPYYLYQPVVAVDNPEAWAGLEEQRQRQSQVMQILVAMVSLETLTYVALLRPLRRHAEIHAYLQFAGDLLLITLLIFELGAAASNFSLLYVFVISVAAVMLPRRYSILLVATIAYLLFVSVELAPGLVAPILNQIRSLAALGTPPLPPAGLEVPPEDLAYSLAVHLIAFYGVGFLTSILAGGAARAEEKLRRKQRDFAYLQVFHRDVLQSISSGLAATDLDGAVTSLNRAGEDVLQISENDLVGRAIAASGLFSEGEWHARTAAARGGSVVREEREVVRRGGEALRIGCSLSLLRDGDGLHRGYIVIFQDLSESTKLREQLRIKDRMAAVGEMAAGLAHEVGNPLAAISGAVQMLAGSLPADPAHQKLLDITLKESRRLDRTVKGFLQLAHPRDRNLKQFDVAALLAEDVTLLRSSPEVKGTHDIVAELDPPSAVITADADQVGQVFWNLARNGLQAMPQGGRLTVAGGFAGDRYRLRVVDTGSGMSEEERTNLFHPFKSFFDGGNGLGMAIVYRIVQEHRGEIHVESAPGRGTTITVDLPIHGTDSWEATAS